MHDGTSLYFGHLDEFGLEKTAQGAFRDGQITESNLDLLFVICFYYLL
jgi:hypothetical protein